MPWFHVGQYRTRAGLGLAVDSTLDEAVPPASEPTFRIPRLFYISRRADRKR